MYNNIIWEKVEPVLVKEFSLEEKTLQTVSVYEDLLKS